MKFFEKLLSASLTCGEVCNNNGFASCAMRSLANSFSLTLSPMSTSRDIAAFEQFSPSCLTCENCNFEFGSRDMTLTSDDCNAEFKLLYPWSLTSEGCNAEFGSCDKKFLSVTLTSDDCNVEFKLRE
ncbi:hypothetical protein BpHYR1_021841 [Brachionus plicatilis]|uniref:Uncharacterized protein n=1 Tax=Brachionus plicatilis TaxID=10195 RepID=A0A3M7T3Y3_BRAPC|nr:hypothetical protein BpHYR1_021841 [Brachionus plicatilis]